MPEGPDVARNADNLRELLVGKRPKVRFDLESVEEYGAVLSGRELHAIDTHGKAMLLRFEGDLAIYAHSQLYGRWHTGPLGHKPATNRRARLILETDVAYARLYSSSDLAVLTPEQEKTHDYLAKLGPDPLHDGASAALFSKRLREDPWQAKPLGWTLLDQSFAAGIGNYLRNEILFMAGVRAGVKPRDLDDAGVKKVAKFVVAIPKRAYESGGTTLTKKRQAALKAEGVPKKERRYWVFRRAGLPCRRCGTEIEELTQNGRASYVCPSCQHE